ADNDILGIPFKRICGLSADAIGLFTNEKQISEVRDAIAAKMVPRFQHRSNDAFRIASAPAIKKLVVFADWNCRGRHGIDVRTEPHPAPTRKGEHVIPITRNILSLHPVSQCRQMRRKKIGYRPLRTGNGRNRHQLFCQLEWMHTAIETYVPAPP